MNSRNQEYDDLIEVAARAVAFSGLTDVALPALANDLMIKAVDLAGGRDSFDPELPPGTQSLPIADRVADAVFERANQLPRELATRFAAKTTVVQPDGRTRH
jgi:hypothetical protein